MSEVSYSVLIPLFALALWLSALYSENKFRYFYRGKNPIEIGMKQAGWRRFVIINNQMLKHIGLFLAWLGFSLGSVLSDGQKAVISTTSFVVGVIGIAIFVLSRLWPFLGLR